MKEFFGRYWKTLVFFAAVGLVGGFFTGLYVLDSYPPQMQQELLAQGLDSTALGMITAVQSAGYGLVLGAAGIWLGRKTGLWRDERRLTKGPLLMALAVGVLGGAAMILSDVLIFGRYSQVIRDSYAVKPTVAYILAAVTYGAVIEEVMLRLFLMSLATFALHRLFGRKTVQPAGWMLRTANVIAALLFAAGHLPATAAMIGLTPMTVLRCFLLNGGIGLLFGWLYRKYGLRYAMLAHGGCHVVSKLIWILWI